MSRKGGDKSSSNLKEAKGGALYFKKDQGFAWVVAFASMVNMFIAVGGFRTLGIFMVELIEVYDASVSKASVVTNMVFMGFCFTAVLQICGVGDVMHERGLISIFSVLLSLGYIVTFFSTNIEHVCVQTFITGAAGQIAMSGGIGMVGKYFEKRLSVANAIVASGVSFGVLVFPPVTQWLINEYTYRGAALILAGVTLNSIVLCFALKPIPIQRHSGKVTDNDECQRTPEVESTDKYVRSLNNSSPAARGVTSKNNFVNKAYENDACDLALTDKQCASTQVSIDTAAQQMPRAESSKPRCLAGVEREYSHIERNCFRDFFFTEGRHRDLSVVQTLKLGFLLFKNPTMTAIQLFMVFSSLGAEGIILYIPAFSRDAGMTDYQSAFLISVIGLGDLLSRIVFGLLGDLKLIERYKLLMIPQFILGTACLLAFAANEFWSLVIFAVVIGLTYGLGYAYRGVLLIDFFGLTNLSRSMGFSNCIAGITAFAGIPVLGHLRDSFGNFDIPIQAMGAILFAGGIALGLAGTIRWWKNRKHAEFNLR